MDNKPPGNLARRTSWALWLSWLGFVIFIVYPLSVGPAIWLYEQGALRDEIEVVYTPLVCLYTHSELAQAFFDWYLQDVWQVY